MPREEKDRRYQSADHIFRDLDSVNSDEWLGRLARLFRMPARILRAMILWRKEQRREDGARLLWLNGDRSDQRIGDVVFVHGLSGDPCDTWKAGHGAGSWGEWLAGDRPDLGFWAFGYPASPIVWKGKAMPLADRAINGLSILDANGLGTKPICFIAHSMGGLLVKQMLFASSNGIASSYRQIGRVTCGIVFFSTPHQGAILASLANYFRAILGSTVALRDLRAHDPHLRMLNEWFRNNVGALQIKVKVFYEMRETYGILVVDPDSANPGLEGSVQFPLTQTIWRYVIQQTESSILISKPLSS